MAEAEPGAVGVPGDGGGLVVVAHDPEEGLVVITQGSVVVLQRKHIDLGDRLRPVVQRELLAEPHDLAVRLVLCLHRGMSAGDQDY